MTERRVAALGSGSYLPEKILTNEDISKIVDTTDSWIYERTGIRKRHIAAEGEFTSHLAIRAAERALEASGLTGPDIDLIVLATTTPDNTFPATATRVQAALKTRGFAFDVQSVCSGFLYALSVADAFLARGQAKRALVIGAETYSRILDWTERETCVLFGDGAGAVVLEGREPTGAPDEPGIFGTLLRSDGAFYDILYVDGGVSSTQSTGHLRMKGREVFRHAVEKLSSVGEDLLARHGLKGEDVDWIVPHQANSRIIDSTARRIGASMDKVILTVSEHGNTSAASVPLALDWGVRNGRIRKGDLLLLEAMGGGLSWGAALLRW